MDTGRGHGFRSWGGDMLHDKHKQVTTCYVWVQ